MVRPHRVQDALRSVRTADPQRRVTSELVVVANPENVKHGLDGIHRIDRIERGRGPGGSESEGHACDEQYRGTQIVLDLRTELAICTRETDLDVAVRRLVQLQREVRMEARAA